MFVISFLPMVKWSESQNDNDFGSKIPFCTICRIIRWSRGVKYKIPKNIMMVEINPNLVFTKI